MDLVRPTEQEVLDAGERGDLRTLRQAVEWVKSQPRRNLQISGIEYALLTVLTNALIQATLQATRQFTLKDIDVITLLQPHFIMNSSRGHIYPVLICGFPLTEGIVTDADRTVLVAYATRWRERHPSVFRATIDRVLKVVDRSAQEIEGVATGWWVIGGSVVDGHRDPDTGAVIRRTRPYHSVLVLKETLKVLVFLLEERLMDLDDYPDTLAKLVELKDTVKRTEINPARITAEDVETTLDLLDHALGAKRWSVIRAAWVGAVMGAVAVRGVREIRDDEDVDFGRERTRRRVEVEE